MERFNRLRGATGFPIDLEIGRSFATMKQERRKVIFNHTKSLVVKIVGFKIEHEEQVRENPFADGLKLVVCLNGFSYSESEPLILPAHTH